MSLPLRVSLLKVTRELGRDAALLEGLGLHRVNTDDPGCVGFTAGDSGCILTDEDFAARCYGEAVSRDLLGQSVPYIYLDRLEEALLPESTLAADVHTEYGTHERVLETAEGFVILAARV